MHQSPTGFDFSSWFSMSGLWSPIRGEPVTPPGLGRLFGVCLLLSNGSPAQASRAGDLIAECLALSAPVHGENLEGAVHRHGLSALSRRSSRELGVLTGLGREDCRRLAATFQLGRLVEMDRWSSAGRIRTPAEVYGLMAPRLRGLERETFCVLLLDGRHRLIGVQQVSEGTLTTSLVHPREVFLPAIRATAAAILAVHNHPSGDPEPSKQDLEVTRRLLDCGRLLGIPLLDHVVVGTGLHVSIRERMEF